MRIYKFLALFGALAAMAGCAGEAGEDGAAGAKGDPGTPGEPGEPGDPGTPGTDGTDGVDATCAGVAPLVVSGVTGVDAPVFPEVDVPFSLQVSGGRPEVVVQFLGTALAGGTSLLPELPVRGATATSFTVAAPPEGEARYVAIASDGCSVTTTTFTIVSRAARVSFVHLHPGVGQIGFAARGESTLLTPPGFGPVLTIGPGSALSGYIAFTQPAVQLDAYPDGDLDETGLSLPALALTPNSRTVVVAYADAAGELAWAILNPDTSPLEGSNTARLQLGNFVGNAASFDLASDPAMTTPVFDTTALGTLSDGVDLEPVPLVGFVDSDGDGTPEWEATLPVAPGFAATGGHALMLFWNDADGALQVLAHMTAGSDGTTPNELTQASGLLSPFLGLPDESATVDGPTPLVANTPSNFELPIDAAPDCAVEQVILRYDLFTEGSTYGSDVQFALIAPSDTTYVIGRGNRTAAGADIGKITSSAPRFELVDGTWTLEVTNLFTDPATLNSATVEFYCGEPLGVPDKVVVVDLDPDLAVPDDATAVVTSTATVTGACTVRFIGFAWNLTHPFASDIQFSLTSPDGEAPVVIGRPPDKDMVSGSFPLIELFAGEDAVGTWTLSVSDLGANDEGTLDDWTLNIYCE